MKKNVKPPFTVVINNGIMNIRYNDLTPIQGVISLTISQYCREQAYATFECWVNRPDIPTLKFNAEKQSFMGINGEDIGAIYNVLCFKPQSKEYPFDTVVASGPVNLLFDTYEGG